jgi:hypothetical protein
VIDQSPSKALRTGRQRPDSSLLKRLPIVAPTQLDHFSKFVYFQRDTQEEQSRAQRSLRRSSAVGGRHSDDEGNHRHRLPLGISVHDHIIVGKNGHASFRSCHSQFAIRHSLQLSAITELTTSSSMARASRSLADCSAKLQHCPGRDHLAVLSRQELW